MNREDFDNAGPQTIAVHAARDLNRTRSVSPPIWQTTTFTADSSEDFAVIAKEARPAEFYTRYGNPTHKEVEETIAALEGGEAALLASSGMGAIFAAVMSVVESGAHVVSQRSLYAGVETLMKELPRFGVEVTYVDQTRPEEFEAALRPNTKLIYTETPTNPLMALTDLRAVGEIARARGVTSIADNTFATPVNQRPLSLGIDIVVHSATKYLGGHHDVTAGCIVASREFIERAWRFSLIAGATLSPFDAWLLLRGLRTLGLRVERHNRNALAIAQFLAHHPKVEQVHHPGLESHPQHELARRQMKGFTGMLSVSLKGGFDAADRFLKSLKFATYAASLGGYETLVVHPAAMWGLQLSAEQQREMGVSENLVRISIGLEDEQDLIADFAQALDA
jgi:methionine-gamma-lyase